jgi:hypothetical protein
VGQGTDGGEVVPGGRAVWTNRYDNSRTGSTLNETTLTPATVSGGKFGLLFSLPVDGTVQAQPLYVPGVALPGSGQHNVLVVGTEADTVFAFDADNGMALWQQSLGTPYKVANADGSNSIFGCQDIFPVIGIHSTPVFDTTTGTMYVLAKVSQAGAPHQFLHALDVTTGMDRAGSPVEIKASAPGSGSGSANGQIAFDPKIELQRAGLLLQNGVVYIAWASHCDVSPWHGWVMAYDAKTLAQRGAYLATPTGNAGGIWQSGMGLSADDTGVYFVSGNGDFDATGANGNTTNKGLSVGRLTLGAGGLTQVDSYTPYNAAALNSNDNDLTSAAVIGPGTNYLYMSGKDSNLRVLDRGNLGGFHAGGDRIIQNLYLGGGHVHGGPVFWAGSLPTLLVWNESHPLKGYPILAGGLLASNPSSTAAIGYNPPHPGAIVTVSSNGTTPATGVVWATTLTQAVSGTYDAEHSDREAVEAGAAQVSILALFLRSTLFKARGSFCLLALPRRQTGEPAAVKKSSSRG